MSSTSVSGCASTYIGVSVDLPLVSDDAWLPESMADRAQGRALFGRVVGLPSGNGWSGTPLVHLGELVKELLVRYVFPVEPPLCRSIIASGEVGGCRV
jgi:hypothetical protein